MSLNTNTVLEKSNWTIWKKAIEIQCLKKGAKKVLTVTADEDSKEEGEAQTIIIRALSEEDQYLIASCTTAKEIMEKLEKRYKQTLNKFTVIRELTELKWTPAMRAEQFVNKLSDIRRRYKMVDSLVADEVFIIKLVSELPNGMETMRTHYDLILGDEDQKNKLKFDVMCSQIIVHHEKECEVKESTGRYNQHVALLNQQQGGCFNCNRPGHFYFECPKPHKEVLKKRLKSRLEHAKQRAEQKSARPAGPERTREQVGMDRLKSKLEEFSLMAFDGAKENLKRFRMDDGSTTHITPYAEDFVEYTAFDEPRNVSGVTTGRASGIGKVKVQSEVKGQVYEFELKEVLHIKTAPYRVLSEIAAEDNGCRFIKKYAEEDGMVLLCGYIGGQLKIASSREIGVKALYKSTVRIAESSISMMVLNDTEWHRRAVHAGYERLDKTSQCVEGMEIEKTHGRSCTCRACLLGRTKKVPHIKSMRRGDRNAGDMWHVDVNNMPHPSLEGYRYALHMVDEATNYQRIGFLKHVSADEVLNALLRAMWEQFDEIGVLPHRIHCDRAAAFMSVKVQDGLWQECRTRTSHSTAYNHQENGIAERAIGESTATMRAIMHGAGVPDRMWAEALGTVGYTNNRLHNRRIRMTPFEALTGSRPDVRNLREFGSECQQHIDDQFRNKIGRTSRTMRMVGYGRSSKVYRIADPDFTRVTEDCNVTFVNEHVESSNSEDEDDNEEPRGDEQNGAEEDANEDERQNEEEQENNEPERPAGQPAAAAQSDPTEENDLLAEESKMPDEESEIQERAVEYRIHRDKIEIPKKFEDIESNRHADLWYDAADEEVIGWLNREPWELVEKPADATVMRGHWMFTVKTDQEGYANRFKARWVVDGSQRDTSMYAPMPSAGSLRTLISFAVREDLSIHVVDVRNAYPNSKLDALAFMYQIAGYEDKRLPFHVCKLKVGAYGLPEAAWLWAQEASNYLESIGLQRCQTDSCIFVGQAVKIFVGLHSDDMIIVSDSDPEIEKFKNAVRSKWQIVDKGPIKNYLGVEVTYYRQSRRLYMNQRSKIKELYGRVKHLCQAKAAIIPLPSDTNLEKDAAPCANGQLYLQCVGSVAHIAGSTRADIMLPINRLAKKMRAPTVHHMNLLLKIIRFLYETIANALKHSRDEGEGMQTRC